MYNKTLTEQSLALKTGDISSVELTKQYLTRIKKYDSLYNSYITVTEEIALKQAREADNRIAKNDFNAMTGIPIAHKDLFCTKNVKTTCASKMLDNFIAPYESHVTEQFHQAGAIMLGKTNMDEFAMGSSNENSYYGTVKNPWDTKATAGGSSGGSAACIAAHLAAGSTGTDTGGSIRQPASHCGITGLKPTYGRVSRFGMIAYASSLDQAGPMAKTAEDCAIMLNIMAGLDNRDSTSVDHKVCDYTQGLNRSLKGLTLGIPEEYFSEGLEPKIEASIFSAIEEYKQMGLKIKPVHFPNLKLCIPTYYIIATAEASSNLSKFDGVRFGYRCKEYSNLLDMYKKSRAEGFGEEVKRRIMIGTFALSSGLYDAYYCKAQKIRRLIRNDFVHAFEECDFMIAPISPTPAFDLGSKNNDPVSMYLSDIYTLSVNLAGLPSIALPVGLIDKRPIGFQLIGRYFEESLLLNAAHMFQKVTDFHKAQALL